MNDLNVDWDRLDKLYQQSVGTPKGNNRPGPEWFTVLEYADKFAPPSATIARTTANERLNNLVVAGVIEKRKTYPAHYYRMVPE